MDELLSLIEKQPGYKISGSHFRLGSKTHISDFYFAKRMFQNSFYASRFAFSLAREIGRDHEMSPRSFRKLTLIGYGLYSELLLSYVKLFLRKIWKTDINHNLISDSEDLEIIKGYEEIHDHVIIIVPIASTFSTSIKIEQRLQAYDDHMTILSPHYNVLLISDSDENDVVRLSPLAEKLGWQPDGIHPNKKVIEVNTSLSITVPDSSGTGKDRIREQKYFIALPSKWHDIKNCIICFPELKQNLDHSDCKSERCRSCLLAEMETKPCPLNEKPLFITDKTSVTPSMVFDLPCGRKIENGKYNKKVWLTEDMVQYGHIVRGENHFHFYIKIEAFFEKNKDVINDWLCEVKTNLDTKASDAVVIVAPEHYSNVAYVNLVNEVLFYSSARILHYDPRKDNLQNFNVLYGDEMKGADKIFFADDTITTGSTFLKTNYFIKLNRDSRRSGFDGCIVLLDRSSKHINENIRRKLPDGNTFFSYANIHLPSLKEVDKDCSLCLEDKRYDALVDISFLDKLKVHFLKQKFKLSKKDVGEGKGNHSGIRGQANHGIKTEPDRYVKRIEAIHRIYEWFVKKGKKLDEFSSLNKWIEDILNSTKSPFTRTYLKHKEEDHITDEKAAFIKVMTQQQFIRHEAIKKKVFKWIVMDLHEQMKKLFAEIENGKIQYNSFRDLKFLMRRGGFLNSNFLMSSSFLILLRDLCDKHLEHLVNTMEKEKAKALSNLKKAEDKEIQAVNLESSLALGFKNVVEDINNRYMEKRNDEEKDYNHKIKNIRSFNVFFLAQIKELLLLNEARSISLEERIRKIDVGIEKTHSLIFKQILRMLREENGMLIFKFWEFIKGYDLWKGTEIGEDFSTKPIEKILELEPVKNHYRYQTLKDFFEARRQTETEPFLNKKFLNYLWLMNFFWLDDAQEKILDRDLNLSEKTDYMMDKLKDILGNDTGPDQVGAFLIVKLKSKGEFPYFLAYNSGASSHQIDMTWKKEIGENGNLGYLGRFLNGEKDKTGDSHLTIIEFRKDEQNCWEDLYATVPDTVQNLAPDFLSKDAGRNLLLVRINKRVWSNDSLNGASFDKTDYPQAILGFYDYVANPHLDQNDTVYLLLLRPSISRFIFNHHERDEFRDWIEADNRQRMSLLTGHGREMLINVALNRPEYNEVVSTLLLVQRLVLDREDEKRIGKEKTGKVIEVFKNIFFKNPDNGGTGIEDSDTINVEYLKTTIRKMAKNIFEFDDIERETEYPHIDDLGISWKGDFLFSKRVMKMIFFELLVNAKKNRWIFLPDDPPFKSNNETVNKNIIKIEAKDKNGNLLIKISNTGPIINSNLLIQKLTSGENPKPYSKTSGLKLIKTILESFELGNIHFNEVPISNCTDRSWFVVNLELFKEAFNGKNTDY